MRIMYSILSVLACLLVGGLVRADDKVPLDELPKPVTKAIKEKFPKAEMVSAEKEDENGKTFYEVVLKDSGKKIEVKVTPDGKIVEIEKAIDLKDLPKAVKEAIEAKYPKASFKGAEEVIKEDKKFYEVVVIADKKKIEILLDPDGKIVKVEEEDTKPEKK